MNIPVESIKIQSVKTDKPNLVLLHGWGSSSAIWNTWLPLLQNHFSVTCIDLPGLGNSMLEQGDLTLDDVLDVLAPLMPEQSYLLGWSLGGLIATLIAEQISKRVLGLVTIGFNPSFVQQADWVTGMDAATFEAFQDNICVQQQATLDSFYALQALGGSQARPILKTLKEINRELSPSHLSNTLRMLDFDARQVLANLTLPSLHIYGQRDKLVPVELVDMLPKWSSQIATLEIAKAGHLPFVSDVQTVTDALIAFSCSKNEKLNVV